MRLSSIRWFTCAPKFRIQRPGLHWILEIFYWWFTCAPSICLHRPQLHQSSQTVLPPFNWKHVGFLFWNYNRVRAFTPPSMLLPWAWWHLNASLYLLMSFYIIEYQLCKTAYWISYFEGVVKTKEGASLFIKINFQKKYWCWCWCHCQEVSSWKYYFRRF